MIQLIQFWVVLLLFGAGVAEFGLQSAQAKTITSTVSVTIGSGGSVGAPAPTEPVTTPIVESTGDANGDGEITTPVGDAIAVQSATFREISSVPQAAATAATQAASSTAAASATASSSSSSAAAAAERFNDGARAASDLFGSASSVAVSGTPNQTFNITLPGETVFSTGSETIDIGGFSHNAGSTPQLSATGAGTFSVAAQVNDAGTFETAGAEDGGDGGNGDGSDVGDVGDVGSVEQILATPVVTRSPFVSIIVSYN